MKYKKLLITVFLMSLILTSCTAVNESVNSEANTVSTENTTASVTETTTSEETTEAATEETEVIYQTSDTTKKTSVTSEIISKTSKKTKSTSEKSVKTSKKIELTYIRGVLIANKTYALPEDYNPGVDKTALNAYYELKNDAQKEGLSFTIVSDFRPYSSQKRIYNNYVARDGKAEADRYSARPGHSEHQTGLAFDLNSLSQSFENTPEGKWLAENCYKYGFIIRYPKGKESVTGYMYEPWHIRYLGKDLAKKVYESGQTLEEYLSITSRYSD